MIRDSKKKFAARYTCPQNVEVVVNKGHSNDFNDAFPIDNFLGKDVSEYIDPSDGITPKNAALLLLKGSNFVNAIISDRKDLESNMESNNYSTRPGFRV